MKKNNFFYIIKKNYCPNFFLLLYLFLFFFFLFFFFFFYGRRGFGATPPHPPIHVGIFLSLFWLLLVNLHPMSVNKLSSVYVLNLHD